MNQVDMLPSSCGGGCATEKRTTKAQLDLAAARLFWCGGGAAPPISRMQQNVRLYLQLDCFVCAQHKPLRMRLLITSESC